MRIKKGDKVVIISGKEKGEEGVVTSAFPKLNKVIVEGKNMVTKHNKPNQQNNEGSITKKEAPIDASNVMILDPKAKKPTRIEYKFEADKEGKVKKVRYAKKSGAKLD